MTMDRSEAALAVSIAALVPSLYSSALPPVAAVRAEPDIAGHQSAALRDGTVTAAAVVLALAAVTRSPVVLAVGALSIAAQLALYSSAVRA